MYLGFDENVSGNSLVFIEMVRKLFPALLSGILLSAILAAIPLVLVCVHEILDGKFPLEIIFQLFAGILALLARRYFTAGCVILFFLLSFLASPTQVGLFVYDLLLKT